MGSVAKIRSHFCTPNTRCRAIVAQSVHIYVGNTDIRSCFGDRGPGLGFRVWRDSLGRGFG